MRSRLVSFTVTSLLTSVLFSLPAHADVICAKVVAKAGKPTLKARTVSTGRCPKGFNKLFDSVSTLVAGPQGIQGPPGNQGTQGVQGVQGIPGIDGSIRIYGDGSAGDLSISNSVNLNTLTLPSYQFHDLTVNSGKTLTVPSGSIIRVSGNLTNAGTILVSPPFGGGQYTCFAGPCAAGTSPILLTPSAGPSGQSGGVGEMGPSGVTHPGGSGAIGIDAGISRALLAPGLVHGGSGLVEMGGNGAVGGGGGGSIVILVEGAVDLQSGSEISADAFSVGGSAASGGGGGIVIIASRTSITVNGGISAKGGNGTPANTTAGSGGPGGGGIVHLIAPTVALNVAPNVSGGPALSALPAGTVTAALRLGGPGGGSCGGLGKTGATVNADGSVNAISAAQAGFVFNEQADPTSLF